MTYAITAAEDPNAAYMPIWAPLLAFNQAAVGDASAVPFALEIRESPTATVAGGLWAMSLWGSFYIALVVAPEGARGRGLGGELMRQAEAEARARGCRQMWLDTYDFQARPFYERLGFTAFGQIDGPAPMFPRWFMQKLLTE
jgi:GNAT superfamily N-acetyltransferase